MADLTPTAVAAVLEISTPYASQLLSGARELSREMAIKLFRATGRKLGPIAGASDRQIATLEAFPPRARLSPANDTTDRSEAA